MVMKFKATSNRTTLSNTGVELFKEKNEFHALNGR